MGQRGRANVYLSLILFLLSSWFIADRTSRDQPVQHCCPPLFCASLVVSIPDVVPEAEKEEFSAVTGLVDLVLHSPKVL